MDYNTEREKLKIAEYGRNVQNLVAHAMTVEDRNLRNRLAFGIVEVMAQMNSTARDTEDFRHKLWDHLLIISNFKLDVDSPYPKLSQENLERKPDTLKYSDGKITYRTYGRYMESIIKKACEYEEGEEKEAFKLAIANQMKRTYLSWNRESVDDKLILDQLKELSGGKLSLADDTQLISTNSLINKNKKKSTKSGGKKNHGPGRRHRN